LGGNVAGVFAGWIRADCLSPDKEWCFDKLRWRLNSGRSVKGRQIITLRLEGIVEASSSISFNQINDWVLLE